MKGNYLLNEYPLLVLPSLATKIGLNQAIILQQSHYWLQKSQKKHDNKLWFYKTHDDWCAELPFWSKSTIRRTISELERDKLLITDNFNSKKYDKTKWYTINYPYLKKLMSSPCVQNEQSVCSERTEDVFNLNRPIPDTPTDIVVDEDDKEQAPEITKTTERENAIQALEQFYLQKKGSGMFCSAHDIQAIVEVIDNGVGLNEALTWTNEVFNQFKPKHSRDQINSFSYVAQYILSRHHEQIERQKALEGGEEQNEKRERRPQGNVRSQSTSSGTAETTGTTQKQRLVGKNGEIPDTECDF
ncbi:hypothetical protein [Bacillus solitudinis]|uniref:hypothetical protein n=1 Tax=Bacillus solitudinis TaxID=2014074 RepID=UPI001D0D0EFA|nr:hypothetical protein [Bacillus solitudinis]